MESSDVVGRMRGLGVSKDEAKFRSQTCCDGSDGRSVLGECAREVLSTEQIICLLLSSLPGRHLQAVRERGGMERRRTSVRNADVDILLLLVVAILLRCNALK